MHIYQQIQVLASPAAVLPSAAPPPLPPWTYNTASYQMPVSQCLRERTVHTIFFKVWDPDTPHRSPYIEETNQHGQHRESEPEHFFHKLTGDRRQADQMSDYWRQHYGLPMKQEATPFQPTWTSATQVPTIMTIPDAAAQLATLLFGPNAPPPPMSSASSGSAPPMTTWGTSVTANMPVEQLRQLGTALQSLSSSEDAYRPT